MSSTFDVSKRNIGRYFLNDFLSSIVVFLVALPLCMGIAIACGMPPATGIITGIIGGIVVSLFSGAPLQVSGPAAGLVVIVVELVQQHGIESLGLILILAGAIQMAAGTFQLGQWFRGVPPAVIHGMLCGIGLLLAASQFHVMVDDVPKKSAIENILSIPQAIYKGVVPLDGSSHHLAALVGLGTIAVIIIWDKLPFEKSKFLKALKHVPGALVAIVAATLVDSLLNLPIKNVQLPANLLDSVRLPDLPGAFRHLSNHDLVLDAIAVAFVASCETMLTCSAIDKLAVGHRTKYDKELQAQGIGNMLCGFIGVLPMTGVIVRSGVNVRAGAKTRMSAWMHGLWMLLFVCFLPGVVRLIPIASLAALLVLTGYKLMTAPEAREIKKYGKSEVLIFLATISTIVLVDLLTGVLVGVVLSIGKLLWIFSHLEIRTVSEPEKGQTSMYLRGAATFLSLPKLAQAIEEVPGNTELHVHLEDMDYIDHACLDLLMNWDKQHRATGGNLVIDWGTLGAMYRDRRRKPRAGHTVDKDDASVALTN